MYNRSNYAPTGKGFLGTRIKDLIQSPDFYKKKRQQTILYLLQVYPTAKESFESIGDLELASFYNSLTYYYNCNFILPKGSLKEDKDSLKNGCTLLPYPPQGWFFNNWTYENFNQPIVYSDSDETKEELSLKNFVSGKAGLAFFDERTIQRNIWFPNGLSMVNKDGIDYWNYVSGQRITWNYPKKWWKGLKSNSYIEVTHTPPDPSVNQSPGWWWNAVVGSGVFLNLGKTLGVTNKLEGVYKLLKTMNKNFLMRWYSTTDISKILVGLIGMCNNESRYCNETYTDCTQICSVEKEGVLQKSNLPLENFYKETIRLQKEIGLDKEQSVNEAISRILNNTDYRLSRINAKLILDETLFFLGLNAGYDTIQFTQDPNNNGYYSFEIIDLRLPGKYLEDAKMRNYTFINIGNNATENQYIEGFSQDYIRRLINEKIISIRDPLDIYNENKVQKCKIFFGEKSFNFFCENVPMSDIFS